MSSQQTTSASIPTNGLTKLEKRAIASLASVFGLRMFGLFLILPVLAIYAEDLNGASPTLMGVALGVYGITQAILQIPFGMLSDRFGRKQIIIFGLLIFALGGLVAAMSSSIWGVILGRALQGAGAIASVILALTSDLTREEQRTKAMASIGMTIGFSFLLALIAAPLLQAQIGVKGLFVLTSVLALLSIVVVWKLIPTPSQTYDLNVRAVPRMMLGLLRHPHLIRLDVGIFVLHFTLTAMFVAVPIILLKQIGLDNTQHWQVYLPALLVSIVFMVPMIILSTRKQWLVRIFSIAIGILIFAQALLVWQPAFLSNAIGMTVCLFFFFWGFNLLEAMLPSLVSRVAPAATRGSAMGVYNTFQFLGVFAGGVTGGWVYGHYGFSMVFIICSVLLILWFVLVQTAPKLKLLDSKIIRLPRQDDDWQVKLQAIEGVEEASVLQKENVAYLKVDKQTFDELQLKELIR